MCQAAEKPKLGGGDATSLVEVGPRACLNPILIFSGAFGGASRHCGEIVIRHGMCKCLVGCSASAGMQGCIADRVLAFFEEFVL